MIVNREDLWPKITRTPIEGQNEGSFEALVIEIVWHMG